MRRDEEVDAVDWGEGTKRARRGKRRVVWFEGVEGKEGCLSGGKREGREEEYQEAEAAA